MRQEMEKKVTSIKSVGRDVKKKKKLCRETKEIYAMGSNRRSDFIFFLLSRALTRGVSAGPRLRSLS